MAWRKQKLNIFGISWKIVVRVCHLFRLAKCLSLKKNNKNLLKNYSKGKQILFRVRHTATEKKRGKMVRHFFLNLKITAQKVQNFSPLLMSKKYKYLYINEISSKFSFMALFWWGFWKTMTRKFLFRQNIFNEWEFKRNERSSNCLVAIFSEIFQPNNTFRSLSFDEEDIVFRSLSE